MIARHEMEKYKGNMANYVIKELPTGMGNGSEGKQFPKMQVYTEFDYTSRINQENISL